MGHPLAGWIEVEMQLAVSGFGGRRTEAAGRVGEVRRGLRVCGRENVDNLGSCPRLCVNDR